MDIKKFNVKNMMTDFGSCRCHFYIERILVGGYLFSIQKEHIDDFTLDGDKISFKTYDHPKLIDSFIDYISNNNLENTTSFQCDCFAIDEKYLSIFIGVREFQCKIKINKNSFIELLKQLSSFLTDLKQDDYYIEGSIVWYDKNKTITSDPLLPFYSGCSLIYKTIQDNTNVEINHPDGTTYSDTEIAKILNTLKTMENTNSYIEQLITKNKQLTYDELTTAEVLINRYMYDKNLDTIMEKYIDKYPLLTIENKHDLDIEPIDDMNYVIVHSALVLDNKIALSDFTPTHFIVSNDFNISRIGTLIETYNIKINIQNDDETLIETIDNFNKQLDKEDNEITNNFIKSLAEGHPKKFNDNQILIIMTEKRSYIASIFEPYNKNCCLTCCQTDTLIDVLTELYEYQKQIPIISESIPLPIKFTNLTLDEWLNKHPLTKQINEEQYRTICQDIKYKYKHIIESINDTQ